MIAAARRTGGGEEDRVMAEAMAALRLAQQQPASENSILGETIHAFSGRNSWPRPASVNKRRATAIWLSLTRIRRGRIPIDPSSTLILRSRTRCGIAAP